MKNNTSIKKKKLRQKKGKESEKWRNDKKKEGEKVQLYLSEKRGRKKVERGE